jgi:hypothetical protein
MNVCARSSKLARLRGTSWECRSTAVRKVLGGEVPQKSQRCAYVRTDTSFRVCPVFHEWNCAASARRRVRAMRASGFVTQGARRARRARRPLRASASWLRTRLRNRAPCDSFFMRKQTVASASNVASARVAGVLPKLFRSSSDASALSRDEPSLSRKGALSIYIDLRLGLHHGGRRGWRPEPAQGS